MPAKAEQYTSEIAIVLIGHFNPMVFQPAWFANQELLRTAEVENANVGVIHPDIVSFSSDWLTLQVTRERFTAATKTDPHARYLNDFVIGTFNKLGHTPIQKLGINCTQTISFAKATDWHDFGHYFCPKSPWNSFKDPGMLQVQIRAERTDNRKGHIHSTVAFAGSNNATLLVNDHYDCEDIAKDGIGTAEYFTNLLTENFEISLEFAKHSCNKIFSDFTAMEKFDAGRN